MDADQFLPWLALLAGGGIATQIATIRNARSRAREVQSAIDAARAKLGPEVDSITVQGAEKAILMMQATNQALERENERKDKEIARLVAAREYDAESLARASATIEGLREALDAAGDRARDLIRQLVVAEQRYTQAKAELEARHGDSRPEEPLAPSE